MSIRNDKIVEWVVNKIKSDYKDDIMLKDMIFFLQ